MRNSRKLGFAAALLAGAVMFASPSSAQLLGANANAGAATPSPAAPSANGSVGGGATTMQPMAGANTTNSATTNAQANANSAAGTSQMGSDATSAIPNGSANATGSANTNMTAGTNNGTARTANRATRHANGNASSAEEQTTRQLNQQQGTATTPAPQ